MVDLCLSCQVRVRKCFAMINSPEMINASYPDMILFFFFFIKIQTLPQITVGTITRWPEEQEQRSVSLLFPCKIYWLYCNLYIMFWQMWADVDSLTEIGYILSGNSAMTLWVEERPRNQWQVLKAAEWTDWWSVRCFSKTKALFPYYIWYISKWDI